jgi:phage portal protein BeeE
MKYETLGTTPSDAQMIEQLKWTAEVVCSTFHVPPYKLGIGNIPTNSNVQSLNLEYYTQALQSIIEAAELCLDEGLGIGEGAGIGTEFDTDNLLRMDSATQMEVIDKAKNVLTLDERRLRLSAPKIKGGGTVYLQQQDHSIEAIAARDAQLIEEASQPAETQPPANDNADIAASLTLGAIVRRKLRQERPNA